MAISIICWKYFRNSLPLGPFLCSKQSFTRSCCLLRMSLLDWSLNCADSHFDCTISDYIPTDSCCCPGYSSRIKWNCTHLRHFCLKFRYSDWADSSNCYYYSVNTHRIFCSETSSIIYCSILIGFYLTLSTQFNFSAGLSASTTRLQSATFYATIYLVSITFDAFTLTFTTIIYLAAFISSAIIPSFSTFSYKPLHPVFREPMGF